MHILIQRLKKQLVDMEKNELVSKNIAENMYGADDPNFKRIHHYDHHVLLYVKDSLQKEKCKSYFEVGTHFGHSLCTILQSEHRSRFGSCDLFHVGKTIARDCKVQDVEAIARSNAAKFNVHGYDWEIFRGDSQSPEMRQRVELYYPDGIDLLFIDGDHDKVDIDFYNYIGMVNKGGYVVFDDYLPIISHKGKRRKCYDLIGEIVVGYEKIDVPEGNVCYIIRV